MYDFSSIFGFRACELTVFFPQTKLLGSYLHEVASGMKA
jgi:hypothetical protein